MVRVESKIDLIVMFMVLTIINRHHLAFIWLPQSYRHLAKMLESSQHPRNFTLANFLSLGKLLNT